MTVLRIIAIGLIFFVASVAWAVLGASVSSRTGVADASLNHEVSNLWGGVHRQSAPSISRLDARHKFTTKWVTLEDGTQQEHQTRETSDHREALPIQSTRVAVSMTADHRKKGLLWFPTYAIHFEGTYVFEDTLAPGTVEHTNEIAFSLPSASAIYDGFALHVDGVPHPLTYQDEKAVATIAPKSGPRTLTVEYVSRGLDQWTYNLLDEGLGMTQNFELRLHPGDTGHDFPGGSLSPSRVERDESGGDVLVWDFERLISGKDISISLPNRLNPGPIVSRITFFAPLSLLFFLVVMTILGIVRGPSLHPMHYLFVSAGFFAFHLLLAYLVDHINIHAAFAISSCVSVSLVGSYLRIVAGARYALGRAGLAQLLFLVLFSYAFFFEGYAGLIVTVGSILTLFAMMQVTARLDWAEIFNRRKPQPIGHGPYRTAAEAGTSNS